MFPQRRSLRAALGFLLALALLLVSGVGITAASPAVLWGNAQMVPNTASLNLGGSAQMNSISCASAGNCSAVGIYADQSNAGQIFVVNKINGIWGQAQEVPNFSTFNSGGYSYVNSISCGSAGNCSAGGYFVDGSNHSQAFVVDEVNGTWSQAQEVPATADLNVDGSAGTNAFSCASAGNCSAGGYYKDSSNFTQAFVVDEVNGVWGNAQEVPNTNNLNVRGYAYITSNSCSSAGNCSAGGEYEDGSGFYQTFVVDETGGIWGNAQEVPHSATLNVGGNASLYSISCTSPGNCSAGGEYEDGSGFYQTFVVDETGGIWGNAQEVPHSATLNVGGNASVNSISCSSPGNCSAGGQYEDGSSHPQALVVDEVKGIWGNAQEVPHSATLNVGGNASVNSISCSSPGNCSAGGGYKISQFNDQAFVVDEVNGTWKQAQEVPNTTNLNADGNASLFSISCASGGVCSAGGIYMDGSGNHQAFVVDANATPGIPTGVTGIARGTSMRLSWHTPSTNGGSAITGYEVRYSSNGGAVWHSASMCKGTRLSCVVTGLTKGSIYIFQVAAINAVGTGSYSSVSMPSHLVFRLSGKHTVSGRVSVAVNKSFFLTVSASGSPSPQFSRVASWPKGIVLSGSKISGKLAKRGTYRITIRATNRLGSATISLRLHVE